MSIVEKMARAIAISNDDFDNEGNLLWLPYEYDAYAALTAIGLTEAQLEGLANGTMVVVPRATLQWWRDLVDLNPQDLAPRMDAMLAAKEG